MALKHGLLGLLTYGSATGYELNKRFQDSLSFFWKGSTSQIYRELNAMEGMGWLTSEYVIQKGKPNKRVYTITEEGRTELRGWISAEDAGIEDALNAKSAFLVRLFFAWEVGTEEALRLLHEFRAKCAQKIEKMIAAYDAIEAYSAMVNGDDRKNYWKVTALFGDEFYRAGLIWADKAIEVFKEMEK